MAQVVKKPSSVLKQDESILKFIDVCHIILPLFFESVFLPLANWRVLTPFHKLTDWCIVPYEQLDGLIRILLLYVLAVVLICSWTCCAGARMWTVMAVFRATAIVGVILHL